MAELALTRRSEEEPRDKAYEKKVFEVHNFAISQGMPKWLAKIVFHEKIKVIWESEGDKHQPA